MLSKLIGSPRSNVPVSDSKRSQAVRHQRVNTPLRSSTLKAVPVAVEVGALSRVCGNGS